MILPNGPRALFTSALVVSLFACEGADPTPTQPAPVSTDAQAACNPEGAPIPAASGTSCPRPARDYTPRSPTADSWPACIADQGVYVPFDTSIASLARVAAFEEIRARLGFGTARVPSPADFVHARLLYSQEQGLESRLSRREDEHYPPAPTLCRDMGELELASYRDRCVGPAVLRPIVNDAFVKGIAGDRGEVSVA